MRVGASLHSRGVWFHNSARNIEKQFTHAALGRLPFVSPHLLPDVRPLAAPSLGDGINGLWPDVRIGTELPLNGVSGLPLR